MIFPLSRVLGTFALAVLLTTWMLCGQANAQAGQAIERATNQPFPSSAVILGGGAPAQTMQRLHVVRQYTFANIRANPHVTLGDSQLDFTPMLQNPKALPNVALRLQALSQHVQVEENTSEVNEVDQGLVIHHVLSFKILPGKCADAGARAQLAQAGIACFTRQTPAQQIAEFSTPGDPHYVADPGKRQTAIALFQRNGAQQEAEATRQIANLRSALANPTQRAAIVAQVGQAEATRLSTLNDDQLKEEMINSSVQRFEEVTYVPRLQSAINAHPTETVSAVPGAGEMAAGEQLMHASLPDNAQSPPGFPHLLRVVPQSQYHNAGGASRPGGDQETDLDLGTYIYLTGFTLGHDYEWSLGVSMTINWCIVGCSDTYSVNLYAGFNYGFGLRFPIQTQLSYKNVVHPNNTAQATLTADFQPINGSVQDFEDTGIESDQLFNGQELVAQVGAYAGFDYNLPVIGSNNAKFEVGVDFTDILPAPYTGGHFQPPAPGTHGIDTPFILNGIDLLGGLLNFGVLGGQVFPAVDINLHSNKLEFTLNDEVAKRQISVGASPQTVSVGVNPGSKNDSHFSFGDPVYNLGFTLTPGIDAHLFINVDVWSDSWDWPVWFPQLAVNLPPNGVDFGCHAGTTCVIDFEPEHQAAETSADLARLESEGCTRQAEVITCTRLQGYNDCRSVVGSHTILGVQSCDPGMVLKEEDSADRTLTGGGCERNAGREGDYLCPLKGMLGLCNTMLKNGAILSCGLLVPPSTDQILKRGGCNDSERAGAFVCPSGMMGLCNLYVKNGVILSCRQGK